MANVVEVIPIPPASGGSEVETGGTYVLRYLVQFDEIHADHTLAITATDGTNSVPAYGVAHPTDTTAYVVDKQAVPDEESPDWWTVTVTFKVPTINPDPPDSPSPPTTPSGGGGTITPIANQKQSVKWYRRPVAADVDVLGQDIVNSAGDPYDPPGQKEELYVEFTITRTQATFDTNWMLDYRNARNHAAFDFAGKTWDAHTLCIIDMQANWPTGSGANAWEVMIVIRADLTGDEHDLVLLDAGYRYLDTTLKRFVDAETGTPTTQPRRLDGAGAELGAGDPSVFNSFRMGPYVDFSALCLSWSGTP